MAVLAVVRVGGGAGGVSGGGSRGDPKRLAAGEANDPVWSPTEDLIVYLGPQTSAWLPLLAVQLDGSTKELSSEPLRMHIHKTAVRFLPNGKGLVYMSIDESTTDFWLLEMEGGETSQLTRLDDMGYIQHFDVTPDGRGIVFDRVQDNADVVLIELK